MSDDEHLPTPRDICKAGLAAAAAAAASVAIVVAMVAGSELAGIVVLVLLFGVPIALVFVLVFALPLYRHLRRRWPLRWWSAALGGFFVGAVPITLLGLPALLREMLSDTGPIISSGPPLILRMLLFGLEAGLPGLVGGLTFWFMLRRAGSCR